MAYDYKWYRITDTISIENESATPITLEVATYTIKSLPNAGSATPTNGEVQTMGKFKITGNVAEVAKPASLAANYTYFNVGGLTRSLPRNIAMKIFETLFYDITGSYESAILVDKGEIKPGRYVTHDDKGFNTVLVISSGTGGSNSELTFDYVAQTIKNMGHTYISSYFLHDANDKAFLIVKYHTKSL